MKIFIAAPYTLNFDGISLNRLRELVKKLGHEAVVPHDFATDDPTKIKDEIQFDLDLLAGSDAILAETTAPSHGVGMEIMYARQLGKKVVLVHKNGNRLSHMVVFHADDIIHYNNIDELEEKLSDKFT